MKKERIVYFDYLRVLAFISVVVLHISAQKIGEFGGRSFEWNVFNIYRSISCWGVPIFVMISGSLFLSRDCKIMNLYRKNILKMVVAYCVWSIFYAIAAPAVKFILTKDTETLYNSIIDNLSDGVYHMWFIPMIVGMYMCVPIIKQIVSSPKITKYFLTLSLIFAYIIPQMVDISNEFIGGAFAQIINEIYEIVSGTGLHIVLGHTSYFIIGFLLNDIELTKKQRNTIYILGVIGFLTTILLNATVAWKTNEPCGTYYSNFSVNVLFQAIAIHTLIKYKKYNNDKLNNIISILSKCSFGSYLVHFFVMTVLNMIGVHTTLISPIISVPAMSAIVVIVSFMISWVINKIPKLNKWIV